MYVYIKSEPQLWTVGFYDPDGGWMPESDHSSTQAAADRAAWLNGNIDTAALEDWSLRALQTLQDFCDEAQVAAGNPDGEDQLADVRALMAEFEAIQR